MDYKEKYEHALKKAKAYDNVREKIAIRFGSNVAKEIFSEYEENEDEKIRKGLIDFLKSPFVNENITDEKVTPWIAWLEKQCTKEPKKISIWKHWKDGIAGNGASKLIYLIKDGNDYSLSSVLGRECDYVLLSDLDKLMLQEKQGEQKPADNIIEEEKPLLEKFKQAVYDCAWGKVTCKKEGETQEEYANRWAEQLLILVRDWADDYIDSREDAIRRRSFDKGKQSIQKPAWSEEDEKNYNTILRIIRDSDVSAQLANRLVSWLKLNIIQSKQEWSEEDEEHLDSIIESYKELLKDYHANHDVDYIPYNTPSVARTVLNDIKFLKSLCPQSKQEWNEEDEKILEIVTSVLQVNFEPNERFSGYEEYMNVDLINWLKSLKERMKGETK